MVKKRVVLAGIVAAGIYFAPILVLGAGLPSQIVPTDCSGADAATKCNVCDIALLAQNVLNTGIFIAVFLSAVLFAYAGWQAVTAAGDTEKYNQARSIFGNVVIGLVIILAGWIVVDTLMRTFLGSSSFGPWNKICDSLISLYDHYYA